MKTVQAPGASDQAPSVKLYLCHKSQMGCGAAFPIDQYNEKSMTCNTCASRISRDFDVAYESVNDVNVQTMLPWYLERFPLRLGNMKYREQARTLALAGGSTGIRNATESERKDAAVIAAEILKLTAGVTDAFKKI